MVNAMISNVDMAFYGYLGVLVASSISVMWKVHSRRAILLRAVTVAVLLCLLYQVLAYLDLGYLDPFFLIATVIQITLGFIISYAVGEVLLRIRRLRAKDT